MSGQIRAFLLTIVGCVLLGFGIGVYITWNKWQQSNQEYQIRIDKNRDMYNQQLENLQSYKDSIESKIIQYETKVDSLNTSISDRNKAIDNLKQEYDEKIDSITSMSHHELIKFFSNRY